MKHVDEKQKLALLIVTCIFLFGILNSCSNISTAIVKPSVTNIRVVMDNNYPPYIFLDEQGKAQGILVDQWKLWEKHTGVKVELSAIPWEDALNGMKSGKFDVIDTIFYTDERAKTYDFTDSYVRIDVPIFFHNNISGIADLGDLKGFRVAVKSGDADAEYLANAGIKNLVYYNSYEEIIQAAQRKEETIFVIDQPPGLYYLYKYGLQDQFNHSAPLFSGGFHRAVKKGDSAILKLVEDGFASISKSEYQVIDERWFGIEQSSNWRQYLLYLLVGSLIALLIIFILIVFNQTLQKRVNQRTEELKQAISSLQKSERKYREIFNATTEAIFIHAVPGGQMLNVNESMLQMYGYASEEEALSKNIGDLSVNEPPFTQLDAQEKIRKALEEGPQVFEWLAKKNTGEPFWAEVSLRSSQIGGENQILAVVRDITERKQSEEALRESEKLLKESQIIANMGSYILDFTTGIWKSSTVLDNLFGIDDTYFRSVQTWSDLIHPDYRQQMNDYLTNEVMGNHSHFDKEYKIIRKNDGTERWVHGLGELEVDAQNRLLKLHGVIQDITARKQVEDEIHQRVMELEMLYESGLAINKLLVPEEIGQKVIELLEQKLGWQHTTVRLYHPQDQSLELLAFNQPDLKDEEERQKVRERFSTLIARPSQGISGWTVQHKQIVRSNDLRKDSRYIDTYPGLLSGLYVPMILGERVIGVISIESKQLDAFSGADERLTATLANQAASALENARLFGETERRFQEFAALYETSNALSADNDLNTLLKVIVDHAATLLNAATGVMYLYNQENNNLEIVVSTTPAISIGTTIRIGEGAAGRVAQTYQPMRVEDYSVWEGRSHTYDNIYFRAILEVPMLFGGNLIGVLNVAEIGNSNRMFTESDERLLSLFAAQAAGALHSAHLREETARRAREFAALYETSNALSAENELNTMLESIVEQAKRLLNSATSGMYLYLSETEELELSVDTNPYVPLGTRLKISEGVAGRVAQTYRPIRIDDYSTWEWRSPIYEGSPIRAVLEVPMLYGGELIGVLTADEISDSKRTFTEADERLLSLFASQAAGAIYSARLREETVRRLNQLQSLHLIDRAISSSFDLRPILNTVITQTISQLNVDAADVLLFHPHLQTLDYVAGQGFRTRAIEQTHLRLGEGFPGRAAFERRTIHVSSLPEAGSSFTRAATLKNEGFLEYYAVPLTAKGEIKGVLEVFHRTSLPLNPEWLDFLETLAGQAAITIDQTQLFDDLQRANFELITAYDATIEGWARAMDLRDKETESHTRRVTELTVALAKALGVKDSEILHIRRGALLHDIGKMGVPDNILLKESELSEAEWVLMRQHPQFAYEMLKPIKYLRQSLDIPYCHHEKWDGTGYPRGLKGEQIPFAARIFAVIDVWDAVIIDRPYRKGWTKKKALSYIKEESGKHFEPRVVDVFLEIFGTEKE